MRGRRDPHDDPAPARPRPPAPAVPTLGALLHQPYWLWLRCNACGHRVAVALVPFVTRWGADTRRRTCCARMHGLRSAWGDVAVPELGGCGCWVAGIPQSGLRRGGTGETRSTEP